MPLMFEKLLLIFEKVRRFLLAPAPVRIVHDNVRFVYRCTNCGRLFKEVWIVMPGEPASARERFPCPSCRRPMELLTQTRKGVPG